MNLDNLADRPDFIATVATWIYQEWPEEFAAVGFDAWLAEFRFSLMRDGVPTTFVATEGPCVMGTASLIATDLPTRPGLWPWLASVYVLPRFRSRGIATALVNRVIEQARWLGIRQVYLQTAGQVDFYRRGGWVERERIEFCGRQVTVMCHELNPIRRSA